MRSGAKQWYIKAMEGRPIKPPPRYAWALANLPRYEETGDSYDWVPTVVVYAKYLDAFRELILSDTSDLRSPLTISEFGIVMRLAFPNCDPCVRLMDGRKARGTSALKGPGSLRTPDEQYAYRRRKGYRNGRHVL